jgi:metal-responsive CopG/Arc/MetJ family transcriptional regulator
MNPIEVPVKKAVKPKKSMISMDAEGVKRIDAIMNKKRCTNRPETIRYLLSRYEDDMEMASGIAGEITI